MKILIACESSATVKTEFLKLGHTVITCDLLPCVTNKNHYQGNVLDILNNKWDLLIAHPPCTYLASSGMHWTTRGIRDPQLTEDALVFVKLLMDANIDKICIENPVGVISTRIKKPTQYIQPYQFGHDASKKTGLWLKNLPSLIPTNYIEPRVVNGKNRWGNQTDSGQNKLPPSQNRWQLRSKTYQGIAFAMADQWGNL
jgi:hypothetical protein